MKISKSFIRYVIVGVSAFVIEYIGYLLLHQGVGCSYEISSIIVYSILFWFVFVLNKQWSFQSHGDFKVQLIKYIVLFIFNNVIGNVFLMQLLVEDLGISALIAPVLKMGVIVIWNYFVYKYIIYQ